MPAIERTLASVVRVFHADRVRAAAPLRSDGARLLADRFDPVDVGIQAGDRPAWVARKGRCQLGERRILIEEMHGNEHELGVTVDGSTADAIDVLREVWTQLGAFDEAGETALDEAPGVMTFMTTMVFKADRSYRELFPPLAVARREVAKSLALPQLDDGEMFKIQLMFTVSISGITTANLAFHLERRDTSRAEDCVYWSRSPLKSEDHLALIEKLFEEPSPAQLLSEAQG